MNPLLIVPYRNRPTHLKVFLLYMNDLYPAMRICVVEQDDDKVWNKGLLFNAAYKELAHDYEYLILHDVDWIPVFGKVDYSACELPTMIGAEASQFGYKLYYPQFFGGVVVLSKWHYEEVNGFSNLFRGYGGEDDHFYRSFVNKKIQPQKKDGRFECFEHTRPDIRGSYRTHPDYVNNLKLVHSARDFSEGLSTAQYEIALLKECKECIHLKIRTI